MKMLLRMLRTLGWVSSSLCRTVSHTAERLASFPSPCKSPPPRDDDMGNNSKNLHVSNTEPLCPQAAPPFTKHHLSQVRICFLKYNMTFSLWSLSYNFNSFYRDSIKILILHQIARTFPLKDGPSHSISESCLIAVFSPLLLKVV